MRPVHDQITRKCNSDSAETIRVVENQENKDSTASIELGTRSYINSTIQAATVLLMQQKQSNVNNNNQTESNPNNIQLGQRIINSRDNNGAAQGNYPPTPVINSLLIASDAEDQGNEPAEKSETISYKTMNRKFP
ncbi:10290_t:CDS:2 [Gigaspora margarita]|uniref:10290_t:CDS:1 n=1 Tax=Gigaspora margarita TaxID=4874 RepID=A0ABN7VGE0_GIGMA|nr:10290_t:CDS:2 [Gigaspora margarita]